MIRYGIAVVNNSLPDKQHLVLYYTRESLLGGKQEELDETLLLNADRTAQC